MKNIRIMKESDISDVIQLWKEVGFTLSESDSIYEVSRMIKHNQNTCLVIIDNKNRLIGSILGGFDGRRGWIHHLSIAKNYQNKGYGKKLLNKLISVFEENHVIKLKLEVNNKDLVDFYLNNGWDIRNELTTFSLNLPRKKSRN